jgi:hypothetical protein
MNAAELRALRDDLHRPVTEVGVETTEGDQFGPRGWYPAAPPPKANQTYELYFRIDVDVEGNTLRISKQRHHDDPYDGVFLPYSAGVCPRVDLTRAATNIVVSAWFSGCTFVKCTSRLPVPPTFGQAAQNIDNQSAVVAHNYSQGREDDENYDRRLSNVRDVCNAAFLDVFETSPARRAAFDKANLFSAAATDGMVIGTLVNNQWQWDWLTSEITAPNTGHIYDWFQIPALDWRSLAY